MDLGLQLLSVQNFQILGDVTVALGRLNVLVGPNGSGKSTLLRVVQFLGDAARSGLSSAIAAHGGIRSVWTRAPKLGDLRIHVRALVTTHAKPSAPDEYTLSILPFNDVIVSRPGEDALRVYPEAFHHSEQLSFKRTSRAGRRIRLDHGEIHFDDQPGNVLKVDEQALALALVPQLGADRGGAEVRKIQELFTTFRVFDINAGAARTPSEVTHARLLRADAGNLAAFLTRLSSEVSRTQTGVRQKPIVLVFGENENDRRAIKLLVEGLRPDLARLVEERRQPLVLIKNSLPEKARSNAEKIAAVARAEARARHVIAVLAHEDCDATEPAHVQIAEKIERQLSDAGCPTPIAVTPAWEMEAWWLVFPEAVGKVVRGWRDPIDWLGKDVGRVEHAKEKLAKAVQPRPSRAASPRPCHERDSIAIAQNIVADGLLRSFDNGRRSVPHPSGGMKHTTSGSFESFRVKVIRLSIRRDPER